MGRETVTDKRVARGEGMVVPWLGKEANDVRRSRWKGGDFRSEADYGTRAKDRYSCSDMEIYVERACLLRT